MEAAVWEHTQPGELKGLHRLYLNEAQHCWIWSHTKVILFNWRDVESAAVQLLCLHKGSTAVAFASKARWRKRLLTSVVWSKMQSVSVRAADKKVLGFPKLKACLPQSLDLLRWNKPLCCARNSETDPFFYFGHWQVGQRRLWQCCGEK